jgi:hypothetical protein
LNPDLINISNQKSINSSDDNKQIMEEKLSKITKQLNQNHLTDNDTSRFQINIHSENSSPNENCVFLT